MSKTTILVSVPRKGHLKYLWFMYRNGLSWTGEGYYGYIRTYRVNKVINYCRQRHFKYTLNGEFSERSTGYRKTFFENNEPFIKNRYFCAYCGRLIRKDKVTVDHLYPVGAAKRNINLQRRLKRNGYETINDVKNLVPACKRCNSSKGKKMGIWILRGRVGRHPCIWVIRHGIRAAVLISLIYYVIKNGYANNILKVLIVAFGLTNGDI